MEAMSVKENSTVEDGSCLSELFAALHKYCNMLGASCPLALLFLLHRLRSNQQSQTLPLLASHKRKILLLAERLDLVSLESLIDQFPDLAKEIKKNFNAKKDISCDIYSSMMQLCKSKAITAQCLSIENSVTKFVSFFDSELWNIQQEFYCRTMLGAWDVVPSQISSNRFIAHIYVTDIEKSLRDVCDNDNGSVCVVELGAGHGVLSYLIARELRSRKIRGTVICTDFHDKVFRRLLQLPWIKDVCESGHLDFAICKAANSSIEPKLSRSGFDLIYRGVNTLSDSFSASEALVIIGNYAFDSFPSEIILSTQEENLYQIGVQECTKQNFMSTSRGTKRQYWMRQMCPFCTSLLSTASEFLNKRCSSCSKPSARPANNMLFKILMNLSNLCCTNNNVTAVNERIRLPFGVHSIPVSAAYVLEGVLKSVNSKDIILLAGDCFVSHDDKRWQGDEFQCFVNHFIPNHPEELQLPFFDPPFISPNDAALAVPIDVHSIHAAFVTATGSPSSVFMSTSCHLSDFSVCKCQCRLPSPAPCLPDVSLQSAPVTVSQQALRFSLFDSSGPNINDLGVVRQLIKQDKNFLQIITLECLHEMIEHFKSDLNFFLEIRWHVSNRIRKVPNVSKEKKSFKETNCWCVIAESALRNHYSTTWTEYLLNLYAVNQWLVSISSVYSLKQCVLHFRPGWLSLSNSDQKKELHWQQLCGEYTTINCTMKLINDLPCVCISISGNQHSCLDLIVFSWQESVLLAISLSRLGFSMLSKDIAKMILKEAMNYDNQNQEMFSSGVSRQIAGTHNRKRSVIKSIQRLKKICYGSASAKRRRT